VPWRKPWQAVAGPPRSMSSGARYRGVNVFLLGLTQAEAGYDSPWWGTYRQIAGLGGQVRRGEKPTAVILWKPVQVASQDPQTGEPGVRQVPVLRYYRVFNAGQADGLAERFHPEPGQQITLTGPQAVLDHYLADGPQLRHVAGDRACYHPATDAIRLPLRSQFRSPEQYYATAFHEAGHSTGHPARLNRPGVAQFDHFGSGRYAREELVAEMTSSILCAQTGIDTPEIFSNSASYIAGWLRALHQDSRLVVTAAAQAQRACDLITQPEREPVKGSDRRQAGVADSDRHVPIPVASAVPEREPRAGGQHGEPEPAAGGELPPGRVPGSARGSQCSPVVGGPAAESAGKTATSRAASSCASSRPEVTAERGGVVRSVQQEQPTARARGWQAEAG
jgi:antirestriction protein ArdC